MSWPLIFNSSFYPLMPLETVPPSWIQHGKLLKRRKVVCSLKKVREILSRDVVSEVSGGGYVVGIHSLWQNFITTEKLWIFRKAFKKKGLPRIFMESQRDRYLKKRLALPGPTRLCFMLQARLETEKRKGKVHLKQYACYKQEWTASGFMCAVYFLPCLLAKVKVT